MAVSLACGLASSPPAGAALGGTTWVAQKVCATAAPGQKSCNAYKLVAVHTVSGFGANAVGANNVRAADAAGPSGGYTPGQVAKAYGLDVNAAAASTQTVAIVDAFDDPTVKTDLASFNAHYGIPAETATSFRVVNQAGATSPLPTANTGWAGEITLDVQAVRGICHHCKILLVEANSNSSADLAAAANRAAAMGATEISNSYGGKETDPSNTPSVKAAYDHPGVVVTASTGDDGWYDFDKVFDNGTSSNQAQSPAGLNTVVGVSGTSLHLNADNTRSGETVWNNNGPFGRYADLAGQSFGAAGGGCSVVSTARGWQLNVSGYGALGCAAGKRSMTDIAAIADPFTGYDIFQTYGASGNWETFGGTSLASPVIAAAWALAGGAGGVNYPTLSLYGHYKHSAATTYDVTIGGTGLCGSASRTSCLNYWGGNPNAQGAGLVDCAFGSSGTAFLPHDSQCYATVGFDGVSGVGTPKGISQFKAMSPAAVIAAPGTVTHHVAKKFNAAGSVDPFPGGVISTYTWHWGDGTTSTGVSPTHNYAAAGVHTLTLAVVDNYGRSGTRTLALTVH